MPIKNRIAEFESEMREWRHDFHRHPELAYQETRTAGIVAEKLRSWGVETHEGIGKTGVVGVIRGNGSGTGSIGIRADMDALPMQEVSNPEYKSTTPERCMHVAMTGIHPPCLVRRNILLKPVISMAPFTCIFKRPKKAGRRPGHDRGRPV